MNILIHVLFISRSSAPDTLRLILYLLHLYTILNYKYLICFANRQIPTYNRQFNQKPPQDTCLSSLEHICPLAYLCFGVELSKT